MEEAQATVVICQYHRAAVHRSSVLGYLVQTSVGRSAVLDGAIGLGRLLPIGKRKAPDEPGLPTHTHEGKTHGNLHHIQYHI